MSKTHPRPAIAVTLFLSALLASPFPYGRRAHAQGAALTPEQQLARDIFRELIEINTTEPQGTTKAAQAMAARLKAAGFPEEDVRVLGPNERKQNLVARLRGRGAAKPILLLAHLDVVEAKKEDWSTDLDPFKFTERDGYFYGRGTSDIKEEAADLLANMIRLKREGFRPDRDIILALTADEEGGPDNGVDWLLKNHRDLIEAGYAINTDAGGGQIERGRHVRNAVQTSEKVYLSFALEVKNKGGHSSLPTKDNAIYRLAEGLARLARFDFPVRLNDTTRAFFARMASGESGRTAADMRAVAGGTPDASAAARLSAASPYYNALLRTTCVATQLQAGHAENALPQTARATVNCRLLPEDTAEEVGRTLVRVLDDPQIAVSQIAPAKPSPASPLTPELFGAVGRVTEGMWPGVYVVPVMETGASDSVYLRQAGVPSYGVSGMFFDVEDVRAHGRDERVGVREYFEGVEFMYRLLKALTSGR
jgi:acetylornithine deacetylase/succinyl-diaminopimelate desuccinylase-like protein